MGRGAADVEKKLYPLLIVIWGEGGGLCRAELEPSDCSGRGRRAQRVGTILGE